MTQVERLSVYRVFIKFCNITTVIMKVIRIYFFITIIFPKIRVVF